MTTPQSPARANTTSRRNFLSTSAATAVGAGLAVSLSGLANVHAGGNEVIRVGLIGCGSERGGRGRGAAANCVNAGPNVKLVAMADVFKDHLEYTRNYLLKLLGPEKIAVTDDRCFVGFDAYKELLSCKDIDLVLLTTPPGFRPLHLQAAVAAGKHIFCEKPVAVDGPGVRSVMKSVEEARKKNISIVSGLCWRYDIGMREAFQRVHDGMMGDIVALQCSYNTGGLWMVPRQPEWSDMEWQLRNWLYFTWLSGDHNVEQHIHSLDKMAWAMKDQYPVKASGLGGRQTRTAPAYGHIFDHHSVVYEFASGVKLFSSCRQQNGCAHDVTDNIYGTKGVSFTDGTRSRASIKSTAGQVVWKYPPSRDHQAEDMYQIEHNELIAGIRAGKPINNGDYMAKSTLMAIMGRMATYTGQIITWEQALHSQEDLTPAKYEFGSLPTPKVAMPGVTRFA